MRYHYEPITADQFNAGLAECGIPLRRFCRLTGADLRRAERWAKGEVPIPPWVGSYLGMLTVPAARAIAHAYAEAYATLAETEDAPRANP